MATTVRINKVKVAVATREAGAKLVRQVLYEVEFAAKVATLGGPYSTGNLAASIHSIGPTFTPIGVTGRVGSNLKYALSVETGAKVHWIFPKGAAGRIRFGSHKAPMLRFFWRKRGQIVFLPHVPGSRAKVGRSHPGQKGKGFLSEPLRRSARIHGMRVETLDI